MAAGPNGVVAYVNARLLDPASGLDSPGALLTEGETIAEIGPELFSGGRARRRARGGLRRPLPGPRSCRHAGAAA